MDFVAGQLLQLHVWHFGCWSHSIMSLFHALWWKICHLKTAVRRFLVQPIWEMFFFFNWSTHALSWLGHNLILHPTLIKGGTKTSNWTRLGGPRSQSRGLLFSFLMIFHIVEFIISFFKTLNSGPKMPSIIQDPKSKW